MSPYPRPHPHLLRRAPRTLLRHEYPVCPLVSLTTLVTPTTLPTCPRSVVRLGVTASSPVQGPRDYRPTSLSSTLHSVVVLGPETPVCTLVAPERSSEGPSAPHSPNLYRTDEALCPGLDQWYYRHSTAPETLPKQALLPDHEGQPSPSWESPRADNISVRADGERSPGETKGRYDTSSCSGRGLHRRVRT